MPQRHTDLTLLREMIGDVGDETLAAVLALSPTPGEVETALYWLNGGGDLVPDGGWPLKGKAAAIYDLLAYELEDEPRMNGG